MSSPAFSTVPLPRPAPFDTSGFFSHHGFWALGVRLFRQLSFSTKAALIALAFALPTLGLLLWLLPQQAAQDMQARQVATRQHVEIALGILSWAHGQEQAGRMSRDEAQHTARQVVAQLRYDQKEYFWISDYRARVVMHPIKPDMQGSEALHIKALDGTALFKVFADLAQREGQGFVPYQWPKPGQQIAVDKISYVQAFKPWEWVVGSGIYVDDLEALSQARTRVVLGVLALTGLLSSYLFICFYRVMDGGLKETRRHLQAITSGDLTTSPEPWGRDEAAELMHELRRMQEALRTMVQRVRQSSDDIVHASSEIASGAQDLSTRTEQSAANLEEAASAMAQIGATVHTGSERTQQAASEARHNAELAGSGGRVMQEVMQTMDGIRSASHRIGDIIATIDGIAFQTNILALNAAVEAARAGEQGRGFAVVASEVRSLAQRSAAAAREIKVLIGSSVDQVESGSSVVRQAGATMAEIVASTQRMDRLLNEVAQGSREQTEGIAQVGHAVQDLDRMTQQNAALVEETAAAAASMRKLAQLLAEDVARFRLPR